MFYEKGLISEAVQDRWAAETRRVREMTFQNALHLKFLNIHNFNTF